MFRDVGRLEVALQAGDLLFIPAFWWKQTAMETGRSLAVTHGFAPHSKLLALVLHECVDGGQC